ncbi:fungal-specific transcription factor domain-containing protein [Mycena amicta]|nr:fungal-specific transcription factor domain-containing protein [Mycena amicta]
MKKAQIPGTGLLYLPIRGPQDEPDLPAPGSKRRRLRGACLECRQRKIRCDRAKRPNNVCSNCVAFNSPCTDAKAENSENIPSAQANPNSAGKTASEHVDTILAHSTSYIALQDLRGVLLEVARYSRGLEENLLKFKGQLPVSRGSSASAAPSPLSVSTTDVDTSPDADALIPDFQDLKIFEGRPRYFGRSSAHYLMKTAEELKVEHDGKGTAVYQGVTVRGQRPEFWVSSWEEPPPDPPRVYRFPPKDLMDDLIAIYFDEVHILLPFLHRPSFERDVATGLHLSDNDFGAVVLGVCALGARNSDDPRVILPGTNSKLSAGWEWIEQIRYPENKEFYFNLSLYELQRVMLTIIYMQGTGSPAICWTLVSLGIRNLQEMGRHRSRPNKPLTMEDELYKRVFWAFIIGDIYTSAFLGRPRATREDDHDIDLPADCDDEYWEHPDPELRFKQPEGKPSKNAYLISHLKLHSILAKAQASLYSLKRSSLSLEWSQATVAELDSELNEWLGSVPDHLRWDPQREDEVFSKQSACLYATYYHIQIQIHRNFVSSPSNHAPLYSNFPSLTICSNAARAYIRVIDNIKPNILSHPQVLASLMDSSLVLLVNVWGARRSGATADPGRAIADLKKCIDSFRLYETRWQQAGRFCDIILAMSDHLLQDPPDAMSQPLKRTREDDYEDSTYSPPPSSSGTTSLMDNFSGGAVGHRATAGSRRVETALQQQHIEPEPLEMAMNFEPNTFDLSLPLSTAQLGNVLPEYSSFTMDWGSGDVPDMGTSNLFSSTPAFGPTAAFSYADFEFVFSFADSALRMPVAPLPSFEVPTFGQGIQVSGGPSSNSGQQAQFPRREEDNRYVSC